MSDVQVNYSPASFNLAFEREVGKGVKAQVRSGNQFGSVSAHYGYFFSGVLDSILKPIRAYSAKNRTTKVSRKSKAAQFGNMLELMLEMYSGLLAEHFGVKKEASQTTSTKDNVVEMQKHLLQFLLFCFMELRGAAAAQDYSEDYLPAIRLVEDCIEKLLPPDMSLVKFLELNVSNNIIPNGLPNLQQPLLKFKALMTLAIAGIGASDAEMKTKVSEGGAGEFVLGKLFDAHSGLRKMFLQGDGDDAASPIDQANAWAQAQGSSSALIHNVLDAYYASPTKSGALEHGIARCYALTKDSMTGNECHDIGQKVGRATGDRESLAAITPVQEVPKSHRLWVAVGTQKGFSGDVTTDLNFSDDTYSLPDAVRKLSKLYDKTRFKSFNPVSAKILASINTLMSQKFSSIHQEMQGNIDWGMVAEALVYLPCQSHYYDRILDVMARNFDNLNAKQTLCFLNALHKREVYLDKVDPYFKTFYFRALRGPLQLDENSDYNIAQLHTLTRLAGLRNAFINRRQNFIFRSKRHEERKHLIPIYEIPPSNSENLSPFFEDAGDEDARLADKPSAGLLAEVQESLARDLGSVNTQVETLLRKLLGEAGDASATGDWLDGLQTFLGNEGDGEVDLSANIAVGAGAGAGLSLDQFVSQHAHRWGTYLSPTELDTLQSLLAERGLILGIAAEQVGIKGEENAQGLYAAIYADLFRSLRASAAFEFADVDYGNSDFAKYLAGVISHQGRLVPVVGANLVQTVEGSFGYHVANNGRAPGERRINLPALEKKGKLAMFAECMARRVVEKLQEAGTIDEIDGLQKTDIPRFAHYLVVKVMSLMLQFGTKSYVNIMDRIEHVLELLHVPAAELFRGFEFDYLGDAEIGLLSGSCKMDYLLVSGRESEVEEDAEPAAERSSGSLGGVASPQRRPIEFRRVLDGLGDRVDRLEAQNKGGAADAAAETPRARSDRRGGALRRTSSTLFSSPTSAMQNVLAKYTELRGVDEYLFPYVGWLLQEGCRESLPGDLVSLLEAVNASPFTGLADSQTLDLKEVLSLFQSDSFLQWFAAIAKSVKVDGAKEAIEALDAHGGAAFFEALEGYSAYLLDFLSEAQSALPTGYVGRKDVIAEIGRAREAIEECWGHPDAFASSAAGAGASLNPV